MTPNHFYVGITQDLDHRFRTHQQGKGAAFTKKHGAQSVEAVATFTDEGEAKDAERECVLEIIQKGGVASGAGNNLGVSVNEFAAELARRLDPYLATGIVAKDIEPVIVKSMLDRMRIR